MDASHFDWLARILWAHGTRRGMVSLLTAASAWPLLDRLNVEAKRKKKKRKHKKRKQRQGANGASSCTPQCTGCGGSDGCGGICGCGPNQICDAGTCRACDVICTDDPIGCGSVLQKRLSDGGTIYVCPGRYRGTFAVGAAKVVGAGKGDDPATNTILDAAGAGRVVTVVGSGVTELIGLHITGGKVADDGGGVWAGAADLRITDCTITRNEAEDGGGIFSAGLFSLTNSTVSLNAGGSGGGVYLAPSIGPKYITNSIITRNKAGTGGGLDISSTMLTMVGTEVSANNANGLGGGINTFNGIVTMNASCRIINNSASDGGGIYNTFGTVLLNGATVSGNSTPQCFSVTGCPA